MKIAVLYDTLHSIGGAERVMIELANYLNADIITSGCSVEIRNMISSDIKVIDLNNLSMNFSKSFGYMFEAPFRFFLNKSRIKNLKYDLYIFSGQSSIFGATKGMNNMWFSHTPNRLLYDLKKIRIDRVSFIKKIILYIYTSFFYNLDQISIKKNIKKIIVNSDNVKKRVKKYYNLNSSIIYPPISTNLFRFKKFGNFYLSVSRLFPEKRIDLIVNAFKKMPDKRLIIVGDGPEKKNLTNLIGSSKNINLLDNVDDSTLKKLYSECLATVYMPVDEDFGLVPLEGMASGKPCIAVNEGGCKETVIDGKTGLLIEPKEKILIDSVKKLDLSLAKKMKLNCLKQAKRFDIVICIKKWKKFIKQNDNKQK